MHHTADAGVSMDGGEHLACGAPVVNRDRKTEVGRDREHLFQALDLQVPVWTADVFEVEADLADDDDHLVPRKVPHCDWVRLARFQRVMSYTCPHLLIGVRERDGGRAAIQVNPHRDQPRHTGGHRLLYDLGCVTELLEVEVCVYEDAGGSSSGRSSSRLKRAWGGGSLRPASNRDGSQRSTASYSPVITLCDVPSSEN